MVCRLDIGFRMQRIMLLVSIEEMCIFGVKKYSNFATIMDGRHVLDEISVSTTF